MTTIYNTSYSQSFAATEASAPSAVFCDFGSGFQHVGISTYFRDFQNFIGCRENLREKSHKICSFLESVGIFYNLSFD